MPGDSKLDISRWCVETLDHRVDAELAALAPDLRTRFVWIANLLCEHGPQQVREPYVKPLGGKLWEMRMKGRDGIARAVYVAAVGKRLVVLHVFVKKTQKTPRAAKETAMRRAEEAGLL
ncbi:type II toxin-antitoxin system RelE/ParE family toxin [Magnetospirillum moscoviense]|uniref:type II toxin-antitoxin system RelE/ParE family toxin n=1 Tax=Magnetospirillum moscoviense TaxID=1437059 RepID=UPI001FE099D3|nr:type II toxin-antitoxin system RelE/ParE family toxin [Magnetospirillum moscoviense]